MLHLRETLNPSEIATSLALLETSSAAILFTEFYSVSADNIRCVITALLTKSSACYPILTNVLRKVAQLLTTVIAFMVNLSLQSGVFPDILKHELVIQLLKEPGVNKENLYNYRLITITLSFPSQLKL